LDTRQNVYKMSLKLVGAKYRLCLIVDAVYLITERNARIIERYNFFFFDIVHEKKKKPQTNYTLVRNGVFIEVSEKH